MNYAEIKNCDIANGPGVRAALFVSGCTHRCKGCFNEITWDFGYGKPFTEETEEYLFSLLSPSYIKGLSLLGGEPMERVNQKGLLPFLRKLKERMPEKNIWCYTGYTLETDLLGRMCREWPETLELLSLIDVLVDGEFVEAEKDISLRFRGSRNQRIIDLKKTLSCGQTVLWEDQQTH